MILKNNYFQVLKVNCQKYVRYAQLGIIIHLCANMKILHVQNVVVIILMMLVQYNKFKSLDNLKNGKFLFGIFIYFEFCISQYCKWFGILYFGINISFGIISLVFIWYSFPTFFIFLYSYGIKSQIYWYSFISFVMLWYLYDIIFYIFWYSCISRYIISFVFLF